MKKLLLKTILVAAAMCVGTNAWGESSIYERGTTNAWVASDVSASEWVAVDANTGTTLTEGTSGSLAVANNNADSSNSAAYVTKTISTTADYILHVTASWNPGNATGNANSTYAYFQFGDIKCMLYGQNGDAKIQIGETTTALGSTSIGLRSKEWTINLTINQKTREVNYTIGLNGSTYTGTGTTAIASGSFNSIVFGHGGKKSTWSNTTTLSKIEVSEGTPITYTSLPFTSDFSTNNNPFFGGEYNISGNGNSGANAPTGLLRVNNTTATAYFGSSSLPYNMYTIGKNEVVTISFRAFHGWYSSGISTISVINSEGVVLAGYTYDLNACKVTDVTIGGTTVATDGVGGRSIGASANCNGLNCGTPGRNYITTSGKNPIVTITLKGDGTVTFGMNGGTSSNYSYTTPSALAATMDIAKLQIVDNCSSSDRSVCIDNLTITSTPLVTFSYEDTDGNSLSDLKANTTIESTAGATIEELITSTYTSTFYNGDLSKKYVYSSAEYEYPSGTAYEGTTVPSTGVFVNLKFVEKEKFTYKVNAVSATGAKLFTILDDTEGYDGDETASIPYDRFYWVEANQTLMEALATSSKYRKTFTLDAETSVYTITYNATSTGRVVYFAEGEDIATLTPSVHSGDQVGNYASGGGVGVTGSGSTVKTITTLPAGSYNVYVRVGGKAGADDYWYIYVGETEKIKQAMTGNLNSYNTGSFTIDADTDIKFAGGYHGSSSSSRGLDYIYIVQTSSYTTSATIGSTGYTTFSSPYPLYLATLTSSGDPIVAYYAASDAVSGSKVKLTSTTGKVPANTGLILKGTPNDVATITATSSGETTALTGNLLVGCDVATKLSTNSNYYVLVSNSGTPEFQCLDNYGATIPAGKAYLNVAAAGARLSIVFDDETTGIADVRGKMSDVRGGYYNLSGQRVDQPQKGLYIVNGKKVVVK